jgi:hypothetical protein
MNKTQMKSRFSSRGFTYYLNRKCEHCGKPIEDQARTSKRHCSAWTDEYGQKHDCKRQKHADKHSREDEYLQAIIARSKDQNKKIAKALADHGEVLTTDNLNAYGIYLPFCDEHFTDGHTLTSKYIDFTIVSNPNTHSHRIVMNID